MSLSAEKKYNYQNYILSFLWLSGTVKAFLNTFLFEFDWTALAMIIACVDMGYCIATRRISITAQSSQYLAVILLIYAWILFSNLYSASDTFKFEKSGLFIANIIFFLYPLFVKEVNFKTIITVYTIVLLPFALFFIYMRAIMWELDSPVVALFMNMRMQYLTVGFQLGFMFILLLYEPKKVWRILVVFLLLLASSARGPLLFTVLILLVIGFNKLLSLKHNSTRFNLKYLPRFAALLSVPVIITTLFWERFTFLFHVAIYRFSSLGSGQDASALERIEMMKFAFFTPFETLSSWLAGYGIGSFGNKFAGFDGRMYPHNLFLEVFFELGIIGIVLFCVLIIMAFRNFSLRSGPIFPLFLFAFLNAMKSNTITDLWILFSLMGLLSKQNALSMIPRWKGLSYVTNQLSEKSGKLKFLFR
ncbi:MAG: O-antigen ligase family protein [Bacteroidales bacterium]